MDSKDYAVLAILCICFFPPSHQLQQAYSPSQFEDVMIKERLRVLNKPPVKTIKTSSGSLVDCVDIYQQPALDHPLLKDHKIRIDRGSSSSGSVNDTLIFDFRGGCPNGTIPIRRTTKEDLLREKFLWHLDSVISDPPTNPGYRAGIDIIGNSFFREAKAQMNIWSPKCTSDQFSASMIRLASGPRWGQDENAIYVGWAVHPGLYGDDKVHLFTYWKGNGPRGCYDMRCPGFVQTDPGIILGDVFNSTSDYDGVQFQIEVHIIQDSRTKDWLLKFTPGDRQAGYWPKELLPQMKDGATKLSFGGLTIKAQGGLSPPMGSGYMPDEDERHSGFMNQINYEGDIRKFGPPLSNETRSHEDSLKCYGVNNLGRTKDFGYFVLFGGPGGADC